MGADTRAMLISAVTVVITIPGMVMRSRANERLHRMASARLNKAEMQVVAGYLAIRRRKLFLPPMAVRIVRVYGKRKRRYDSDNLCSGAKSHRDSIAKFFGVDDGRTDLIRFTVDQEPGPADAVRIELSPMEVP